MVSDTHTVVEPNAMVIVSLHTDIANGAMSGLRGPDDFAVRTQFSRVEFLEEINELDFVIFILSQDSRVFLGTDDVRDVHLKADHG